MSNKITPIPSSRHSPPVVSAPKPENARALAALLLLAAVAALAVVADQLIDTWVDGHLFLAWITLWGGVFAGSLLLTGSAQRLCQKGQWALKQRAERRAQTRATAQQPSKA